MATSLSSYSISISSQPHPSQTPLNQLITTVINVETASNVNGNLPSFSLSDEGSAWDQAMERFTDRIEGGVDMMEDDLAGVMDSWRVGDGIIVWAVVSAKRRCAALLKWKPNYDFFVWPTTAVHHLRGSFERWTQTKYPFYITSHHIKPIGHPTIHYYPTQSSRTPISVNAQKHGTERQVKKEEKEEDFIWLRIPSVPARWKAWAVWGIQTREMWVSLSLFYFYLGPLEQFRWIWQ